MSRRESSCIIAYIELNFNLHSYTPTVVCSVFLEMLEWITWTNVLAGIFTLISIIATLSNTQIFSALSNLNNLISQKAEDLQEFNRVQLVLMENQMETAVYVQWGKTKDDSVGYGELIRVPPKTAIGRKIHCQNSRFSSERHSVRVWKQDNRVGENVVSLLWQPGDHFLPKCLL